MLSIYFLFFVPISYFHFFLFFIQVFEGRSVCRTVSFLLLWKDRTTNTWHLTSPRPLDTHKINKEGALKQISHVHTPSTPLPLQIICLPNFPRLRDIAHKVTWGWWILLSLLDASSYASGSPTVHRRRIPQVILKRLWICPFTLCDNNWSIIMT